MFLKLTISTVFFFIVFTFFVHAEYPGTGYTKANGYDNCITLFNKNTRVILEPNFGGRILSYAKSGNNVLYVDTTENGYLYEEAEKLRFPSAGRFDIGPEKINSRRMITFFGSWEAKITGPRKAKMISKKDTNHGVQLIRIFELDKNSSYLRCKQIIKNISDTMQRYCH